MFGPFVWKEKWNFGIRFQRYVRTGFINTTVIYLNKCRSCSIWIYTWKPFSVSSRDLPSHYHLITAVFNSLNHMWWRHGQGVHQRENRLVGDPAMWPWPLTARMALTMDFQGPILIHLFYVKAPYSWATSHCLNSIWCFSAPVHCGLLMPHDITELFNICSGKDFLPEFPKPKPESKLILVRSVGLHLRAIMIMIIQCGAVITWPTKFMSTNMLKAISYAGL